ncbi:hypothetical protein Ae201684P_008963 [Aphanomyces euteiches]|nr:hypothetical protein Ae201684P_008963 [Aphanomyces euteiches]
MTLDVQILSVASTEMYPSVMVTGETQRYLFNAGEGLQRLCMEHRVRLAKLQHVCLTQVNSSTVGGLPGLILTVSDTGKKGLKIVGPTGTHAFMRATRHFLYRPNFKMDVQDLTASSGSVIQDESMTLQPVVVTDEHSSTSATVSDSSPTKRIKVSTPPVTSVSYIGETPTQRGKFLIQKALAFGVPKGPLCGALHRGEDVTIQVNGEDVVVKSVDCVSPSIPGTAFAILACPTVGTIDSLVEMPHFKRYQGKDGKDGVKMSLLVHLGNLDVLSHPRYTEWVKAFGPQAQHILVNHPACPMWTVFRSSVTLQAQLHHVFPSNFAATHHEVAPAETIDAKFGNAVIGQSLLKYTLVPAAKQGFERSQCFQPLDVKALQAETNSILADANIEVNSIETLARIETPSDAPDGRVTLLGTGSAIPSKYRNVTSNLIEFGKNFMLLDSGEGTYGQLFRYVAGDEAKLKNLVDNLYVVWISHNHADHHLGLIRLLTERSNSCGPLAIVGPTPVYYWLQDYAAVDPSLASKYIFENNMAYDVANSTSDEDLHPFGVHKARIDGILSSKYGIDSFQCVPVKHCYMSYAVVLTCADKFKLVFSGDCRPCDALIQHGNNADLLIHEATFEGANLPIICA